MFLNFFVILFMASVFISISLWLWYWAEHLGVINLIITDAEYCGHNPIIIKTMKIRSCQDNRKFIHQKVTCTYMIYINIKNCGMIRDFKRMTISKICLICSLKYQNHELKARKHKVTVLSCFLVRQFWIIIIITVMHW